MEDHAAFDVVDARDDFSFLIFAGIASADQHDAYGSALVDFQLPAGEVALCHTLEQVHEVALCPEHDGLGLGVSHAAVVFDDLGIAVAVDESEEDESFVVQSFCCQTLHRGTDDAVFHLLHPRLIGKRYGRDAAHASGVQTRVAFAYALVVLGFRQDLVVPAVGEDKDGAFNTAEELLDDYARRSLTEHTAQHLAQLLLGLLQGGQDEHALAGTESVGFQDIGRLQGLEELNAFLHTGAVEGLVGSRGDAVALHESFGEVLAAFELSTGLRGTDDGNVTQLGIVAEEVVDALHQRVLRTHNDHVHLVGEYKVLDARKVIGLQGYVLAHGGGACVAGGNVQFLNLGRLGYFPCEGVFASATA